jgi:FkbM family methyltransferase
MCIQQSNPPAAIPLSADLRGSLSYLWQRLVPFRLPVGRHRASGLRFRFRPRDVVGRHILRYQDYEPAISACLLEHLRGCAAPGLFVDVGANIGWFSLNAARCPGVSQVLAFEPDPGNHALLCENLDFNALSARVLPIACALGAANGMALLHRYRGTNPGRHSLLQAHGHGQSLVAVETLDAVLTHLGYADAPIHTLKLDVEGYEPAVMAGASRALERAAMVVIELSRELSEAGSLDFEAMLAQLAGAGLRPCAWDHVGPVPGWEGLAKFPEQCTVVLAR